MNKKKTVAGIGIGLPLLASGMILYLLFKNKKVVLPNQTTYNSLPSPTYDNFATNTVTSQEALVGDVDGNGIVDDTDWYATEYILFGINDPNTGQPYTSDQMFRADTNSNGEVDMNDLVAIENNIVTQNV